MKNLYAAFPTRSNSPDANYPTGSAKDVVTQGDGTGTPWIASLANDIFGFFQRCLYLASISASNNSETAVTSQVHEGIRLTKGLPGEIIHHCWSTIPTGVRVINLEGQVIGVVGMFAELVAACYCGDALNDSADGFYKTSDIGGTIRSTSGQSFVLPDARGRFLRVLDDAGTVDIDGGGSRIPGSDQNWAITKHWHRIGKLPNLSLTNVGYDDPATGVVTGGSAKVVYEGTGTADVPIVAQEAGMDNYANSGLFSYRTSNNEIRPQNMGVRIGIWY